MNEDLIVTQIGLIFSQVRYLRMAVEQLERNTSRYAGIALDAAFAGPGGFGAPPMEAGALRVHVINIADLIAQDNSFLGVLGGLLRAAGSLVGGLVSGAVGGVALPVTMAALAAATANIVQILRLIGFGETRNRPEGEDQAESSSSVFALLDRIESVARELRQVLGLTNAQQQGTQPVAETETTRTWLDMMRVISHIVDGLIILVPILIGAFASMLVKIEQLKIAIVDMLEFAVRNMLLLRGILLVTIYDTVAAAARMIAGVLNVLGTAINGILGSIFRMLESALAAVMGAIEALSGMITRVVNALLPWLVNTVITILRNVGELRVFKMLFGFVQILPSVLPPIFELLDKPLNATELGNLASARDAMQAAAAAPASTDLITLPEMPDFAAIEGVPEAMADAAAGISGAMAGAHSEVTQMFATAQRGMEGVANVMEAAVGPHGEGLTSTLQDRVGGVITSAETLTQALRTARDTAAATGGTGLEAIAGAYERWITGTGLNEILERITTHFSENPAAAAPAGSILGRITAAAGSLLGLMDNTEPARPTVEIGEVVVEIDASSRTGIPAPPVLTAARRVERDTDVDSEEFEERGGVFTWGLAVG
jgi:hypothetical protein